MLRVQKYSPNGKLQFSWREPGTDSGAFNIMHNICCDEDGWVYRVDRENRRVQVFDGKGRYQSQWYNMHRPCGLCMTRGRQPLAYTGESGPGMAVNAKPPGIGPHVSIWTHEGKPVARLGDATRERPSQFIAPHGVAIDSRGDIHAGEVSCRSRRGRISAACRNW